MYVSQGFCFCFFVSKGLPFHGVLMAFFEKKSLILGKSSLSFYFLLWLVYIIFLSKKCLPNLSAQIFSLFSSRTSVVVGFA